MFRTKNVDGRLDHDVTLDHLADSIHLAKAHIPVASEDLYVRWFANRLKRDGGKRHGGTTIESAYKRPLEAHCREPGHDGCAVLQQTFPVRMAILIGDISF